MNLDGFRPEIDKQLKHRCVAEVIFVGLVIFFNAKENVNVLFTN